MVDDFNGGVETDFAEQADGHDRNAKAGAQL